MNKNILLAAVFGVLTGCGQNEGFEQGEDRPGGDTSVNASGRDAFSHPAANMPMSNRLTFSVGNSFFTNPWVAAPSSTKARDGLGPLFNTNTCQSCHIKDGRGHAPAQDGVVKIPMLVKLSIPARAVGDAGRILQQGAIPEPVYGGMLHHFSLPGGTPEGEASIKYEYTTINFKDGEAVELRKPVISISKLGYGPLSDNVMLSARIAPAMIGLGLLESITDIDILRSEDPGDHNGDGISGRVNNVWDVQKGKTVIGRFGWKASQPTVIQQSAAAFSGDMGITSTLFPEEPCTSKQTACTEQLAGEQPEVSDKILEKIAFYARNLAVPVRKNANDKVVLSGKRLFKQANCSGCHIPSYITPFRARRVEQSSQLIWPYTDLLLHDMGEGLADNRPEFEASGKEWRTAPLWGIGRAKEVNPNASFLHDGRARNLMEAILWHGGEAERSKQAVINMNQKEREALLAFLNSL